MQAADKIGRPPQDLLFRGVERRVGIGTTVANPEQPLGDPAEDLRLVLLGNTAKDALDHLV